MSGIPCKTCDNGQLEPKKVYRLGGIVAAIGFFLLIPSAFGVLMGGCMMVATGAGTAVVGKAMVDSDPKTVARLVEQGVPAAMAKKVASGKPVSDEEMSRLTPAQKGAVQGTIVGQGMVVAGAGVGAAMGFGAAIVTVIMSVVGGLLGWLLVLKKRILQCGACGAAVAAS